MGNTTAVQTVAIGYQALMTNTTGFYNTALGYQALYSNTTGAGNIAVGQALYAKLGALLAVEIRRSSAGPN